MSGGGGVLVLIVALFVFPYTVWRSIDFINQTIPRDLPFREIIMVCALGGLDVGAIVWGICWMRYTIRGTKQDMLALVMWIVDMAAVLVTGVGDSIINTPNLNIKAESLELVSLIAVVVIIILNVVAFWAYHMWSPATEAERKDRERKLELEQKRAEAFRDNEYTKTAADIEAEKIKLGYSTELHVLETDLQSSEDYLKARALMLKRMEEASALKVAQDDQVARLSTNLNIIRPGDNSIPGQQPEQTPTAPANNPVPPKEEAVQKCAMLDCKNPATEIVDGFALCKDHADNIRKRERMAQPPSVPPPPVANFDDRAKEIERESEANQRKAAEREQAELDARRKEESRREAEAIIRRKEQEVSAQDEFEQEKKKLLSNNGHGSPSPNA